jgi:hypothetical protein
MASSPIGRLPFGKGRLARRLATAVLLFSASVLFPAIASACPICAGRADAGPMRGVFLALFIFFPFALVYGVIRYMRAQAREAQDTSHNP